MPDAGSATITKKPSVRHGPSHVMLPQAGHKFVHSSKAPSVALSLKWLEMVCMLFDEQSLFPLVHCQVTRKKTERKNGSAGSLSSKRFTYGHARRTKQKIDYSSSTCVQAFIISFMSAHTGYEIMAALTSFGLLLSKLILDRTTMVSYLFMPNILYLEITLSCVAEQATSVRRLALLADTSLTASLPQLLPGCLCRNTREGGRRLNIY